MPEFNREQLRKWAISGAEQRLLEIASEAAAIYRAFPELRERATKGVAPESGRRARAGRTAKRTGMSAASRQAVSERMKRYWADRRGGASSGKAPAATRGRRKLSAAARKRISDAQKKRWAAQRKEKG